MSLVWPKSQKDSGRLWCVVIWAGGASTACTLGSRSWSSGMSSRAIGAIPGADGRRGGARDAGFKPAQITPSAPGRRFRFKTERGLAAEVRLRLRRAVHSPALDTVVVGGSTSCASFSRSSRSVLRPINRSQRLPCRKMRRVGMAWTPYRSAKASLCSTSTSPILIVPAGCSATESSSGAMTRQRSDHPAQNWTRTGSAARITSCSKLGSLSSMTLAFMGCSRLRKITTNQTPGLAQRPSSYSFPRSVGYRGFPEKISNKH